jgi:hypothetical protein
MNNRTALLLAVIALAVALAAAAAWYQASTALNASRARLLATELQPLAALLQEDQALIQELQRDPFTEVDSDILESYLAKLRRDGVAKHADMRLRLDQLAENNTAIVTLIKAYAPRAQTAAFSAQADKFRNYAAAWRDRWNSVMELFMAGGNYPASSAPFPSGFPQAVQAEIAAAK